MNKRLLLLFSFFFLAITAHSQKTLKLRSGELEPNTLNAQLTMEAALADLNHQGDYFILQFDQIPTEQEKAKLSNEGVELLEYVPEYAFIANLKSVNTTMSLGELGISSIIPFDSKLKFPEYFDLNAAPEYVWLNGSEARLMIDRQLDHSANEMAAFLESNSIRVEEIGTSAENFKIAIAEDRVSWLAEQEIVKFIDYAPAPPEPEDREGRSLHRSNLLDSDDPMGRNYTGDGVSIAIADNGLTPHIDRIGRVTMHTSINNGDHGDMTTGIAMGAGNRDPRIKGAATKAYLHYYHISGYPHINSAATNYTVNGVAITSTSFSQGCNAGYTSDTRAVDQQVGVYSSILHVFSAGNSSGSTCGANAYGAGTPWGTITGGIKQGKNVIATANLDDVDVIDPSSSRGPAADGRIKPDISANGRDQQSTHTANNYRPGGGTSAAAPSIAGIAAQLYEGYRDLNSNTDPESGLIKAAMLNTAKDLGNRGPDFFFGWGRVNANRAMKLLEDRRYLDSSITQNTTNSHSFSISQNLRELRVMVYWTDKPGSTTASKALVNDIDIKVITPNNDTILPWVLDSRPNATFLSRPATRGIDDLNNVEQVSIDTASAGTYTVLVDGKAIPQGPQTYHLLWETISDTITVTFPAGGESFVPGQSERIRWDADGNSGSFTVEYSLDSGATWSVISSNILGSRRFATWPVNVSANTATGNALIRVSRNGNVSGVSRNTFNIMGQPTVGVSFACPDSIGLTWSPVSGATHYEILMLGSRFMDSITTTATNSVTLYNLNLANDNWVSVRAMGNGVKSLRTEAQLLPKNISSCYPSDLEVAQIIEPSGNSIISCLTPKVPVRIGVRNNGTSPLSNIPVSVSLGTVTLRDTIPGPVIPNGVASFRFADSLTITTGGTATITAANEMTNDPNSSNDIATKAIDVVFGSAFTVPYSNDFESFSLCQTANGCSNTPSNISCTLNGGWLNVDNSIDDFDMRTNSGGTPSTGTGPTVDHNPGTGSGKYIYSEASGGCTGQTAQLMSPCFDLTGTIAPEFSFWYHMSGSTIGNISVDILTASGWNFNVIPVIAGNQGASWNRQTINLSNYVGQTIIIRFRITTGSSFYSDIAIDDVSLYDNSTGLSVIKSDEYSLYPNPSEGQFNIRLKEGKIGDIRIFDLQGRNVFTTYESSSNTQIDLSNLDKGIYIIEFNEGRREKIMIQ